MVLQKANLLQAFFKKYIWPIDRSDMKLFMPLAALMFCILFNFSALRSIKDSLIVSSVGAEAISFLKLWMVFPSAILLTISYVKLSNLMKINHLFYLVVGFFLGVFWLFAFVLYPNQEFFHPSQDTVLMLAEEMPYLKWFIFIFGKWTYAVMYLFCELWGAMIVNLMFWQFANHIISTDNAKKFYPLLGMIGNAGLIASGSFIIFCSDINSIAPDFIISFASYYDTKEEVSLKLLISVITISALMAMFLFGYISKMLDTNQLQAANHKLDESQTHLSIKDSIKLVLQSRYIAYIAMIVLSYGLAINVLEGPWKAKIRELYPTTQEYLSFMGQFNVWMGISSVTFTIIAGNVLRHFTWFIAALMTPAVIIITGSLFFGFVLFGQEFTSTFGKYAFNPVAAAVFFGALQNILSKSTKYSLFDSTKEMAYIPLSLELRTKGKATVEVIASKLGKSLGAFVQSGLFTIIPTATFASIAGNLMVVFLMIMTFWFYNVMKLNKAYTSKLEQVEKRH